MTSKPSEFLTFLEYFINDYLNIIAGYSKNTIKSYKYSFKLFFDFMLTEKNKTPDQITFKSVNASVMLGFMKWLKEKRGCCQSTLQQRLAAFLTFSEYAQNRNFDAACSFRNGVLSVPRRTVPKKNIAFFTVNEMEILLKTPDDTTEIGYRDLILMSVMYASGARAQEICDLTVGSIIFDSERTLLIIHGKGDKTRRILLSKQCAEQLKKYLIHKRTIDKPERYVFYANGNKQMTIAGIEKTVKKYVRLAKEQNPYLFQEESYSPHSFRHSTATHMLEAGVPLIVIKNFLGHASVQTTQIYAEISANKANQYLKEWNSKWFPNKEKEYLEKQNQLDFLKV